jgi:uncharacterized Fe-S cluster-containing radical SAM superfamily protein
MFDPVALAIETERSVISGEKRRYYRFRGARFYGGIATADCLGCCLRCSFCWARDRVLHPGAGRLYSPEQVAQRITNIALKRGFSRMRISGNEPTIGRAHLLGVLARLPVGIDFILETNGILLGHDRGYARALAPFASLHVRVGLKGCTAEEFSKLTGAGPAAFELPFKALEHLLEAGVSCHPAVMLSFSSERTIASLASRLAAIHPGLAEFEAEEVFNPRRRRR